MFVCSFVRVRISDIHVYLFFFFFNPIQSKPDPRVRSSHPCASLNALVRLNKDQPIQAVTRDSFSGVYTVMLVENTNTSWRAQFIAT